jgi:hypothetical protein
MPLPDRRAENLGVFEPIPFEQIGDAERLRVFDVNVVGGTAARF